MAIAVAIMATFCVAAAVTMTAAEYRAAVTYMRNCGIEDGFVQERTSAEEAYTPTFDGTGV